MATPLSVLLRLLFPSWEFFDVAQQPPALEARVHAENHPTGGWQRVVYPPTRRWWHLIFNPAGTNTLAAQTIVERCYAELINEHGEPAARQQAITAVDALVESWVRQAGNGASGTHAATWQWRIAVHDDDTGITEVIGASGDRPTDTRAPHTGAAS